MELKEIFKLEGEIWRDVVGYEGLYEVSNYGRVASLNYYKTGNRNSMTLNYLPNGYVQVILSKDGKKQYKMVHRLVAEAFPEVCGTYFEGAEIDHINTIRYDNRAENLRWVTRSENLLNPITRKKLSETMKGKNINHPSYSKQVVKFDLEGNFIAEYPSIMEASRQTGVDYSSISKCCKGKIKKDDKGCYYTPKSAGGFIWKYKETEAA